MGKREGEEEEENVHVVFGPQNVKSEGSEGFEDFVVQPVTGCETADEDDVLTHTWVSNRSREVAAESSQRYSYVPTCAVRQRR